MIKAVQKVVSEIQRIFEPVSVFLYGSRARTDYLTISDYEIGVLFKNTREITRTRLQSLNPHSSIILYPFEYEKFLNGEIDTPFPEHIYLRELRLTAKTLSGQSVVESFTPPPISILNLLERVRFDTGQALGSLLSQRHGDIITAKIEFSKSCLFGIRCLIILTQKLFPATYDDIYSASRELSLEPAYLAVIKHALDVRKGADLKPEFLYKNITLLNQKVKSQIRSALGLEGDQILIP